MTGTFQRSLDSKGRLMLPPKMACELGDVCYLAMGVEKCLTLYPQWRWEELTEKMSAIPMSQSGPLRSFFANVEKCYPDAQARITVPPRLQTYAGLTKDVAIIGVNDRLELWDADAWKASDEEMTPEKMKALMTALNI